MKHLPKIKSITIPHKKQFYDTAGNYGGNSKEWWFEISKMEDWRYEFLVLMHEIGERGLCQDAGIKLKDIDYFDIHGEGKDHPDPGTLKNAPYRKQHMLMVKIEKMLCKEMGIDFKTYDNSFNKLKWKS